MDFLYKNSLPSIALVQQSFNEQQNVMFALSNIFDPKYAFLFYAPLFYSFDHRIGTKMMWASVISEWSNHLLKWFLHGERPYWWIHEFNQSLQQQDRNSTLPTIEQTFMTCETGPGSPSGHAMVTACVWYVIIDGILNRKKLQNSKHRESIIDTICWSFYTLILCAVSLSRIYIAAHFPHQCLLGMAMGIAVAKILNLLETESFGLKVYLFGTFGLIGSAIMTYFTLILMGFNPHWSVERALKWCARPEHVRVDTTPFYSMMRYSGFFAGIGLGFNTKLFKCESSANCLQKRSIIALLSLIASSLIQSVPLSREMESFKLYGIVFLMNMVLPYLFIALIPFLINRIDKAVFKQKNQ
ncbi:glucose-6-phosphatase-like protein [Sarcoptes scabiei]|uniref:Glucose-6-phosphatase n=1 Tax=Sarcoptes scabiei TaxID=52283 RepID=A0A132A6S6_SARSC|nr:glucose-6-phosphatase-like protein [Sarcoptes scabiei]